MENLKIGLLGAVLLLGLIGMPQAYTCAFSNITVNAMCNSFQTDLTSLQANTVTIQSNVITLQGNVVARASATTNSLNSLHANQSSIYNETVVLRGNITTLSSNQITIKADIAATSTTLSAIAANSTSAKSLAVSANKNATAANKNATLAIGKVADSIIRINNLSQYTTQHFGIINTTLSPQGAIGMAVARLSLLNITSTYPKVKSDSQSSGELAGIALIVAILVGAFVAYHHLKVGHGNKQSPDGAQKDIVGRTINSEQQAKQAKTNNEEINAKNLVAIRLQAEKDAEAVKMKAELDKKAEMEKDEKFIAAKAKFVKDVKTAQRLKELSGETFENSDAFKLPSYKKLEAIMAGYGQKIEG